MAIKLNEKLIGFAKQQTKPIYLVGGAVRNYIISNTLLGDLDIAGAIPLENFKKSVADYGFNILAQYPKTQTLVFSDGQNKYEYSSFRKETYISGEHTPQAVEFTEDILEDALRRDFKCNAIYYDVKSEQFIDPLNGINDIKNKVLDTTRAPKEVFKNDGLRLMRLARFCGQLGFKPTENVISDATECADNINYISPERIYDELKKILIADKNYPFSAPNGHYDALKILERIKVLDKIIPELTLGRDMAQRSDFHDYDVLEHSLRSVLYAHPSIRLYALLHDVGKPYCMKNYGKFHAHDKVGENIVKQILSRLKAESKTIKTAMFLTKWHMIDIDLKMSERKIKSFIIDNFAHLNELFLLKDADFKACKDSPNKAPAVIKWKKIIEKMKSNGVPFSIKELKISADTLIEIGFKNKALGDEQKKLFQYAIENPEKNNLEDLKAKAIKDFTRISALIDTRERV